MIQSLLTIAFGIAVVIAVRKLLRLADDQVINVIRVLSAAIGLPVLLLALFSPFENGMSNTANVALVAVAGVSMICFFESRRQLRP